MSLSRLAKRFVFLALMILPFGPSRFAAGAEPTRSEFTLNIDVYSGSVSSSELESGFRLGLLELEKGYPAPTSFVRLCPRVIPLQHRVEKDFLIGESGETDGEKVVAVAHVTTQPNGKLEIEFSELGRPPAFDGATELIMGKGETRVLQLPAVETDKVGGTLRTVVSN
ncbi:MAG: hypothetical protein QOI53_3257 [Verrucomicrobiota bacterium]|nr:hypothetical protein [Verrucomicrobiota bacterium]